MRERRRTEVAAALSLGSCRTQVAVRVLALEEGAFLASSVWKGSVHAIDFPLPLGGAEG